LVTRKVDVIKYKKTTGDIFEPNPFLSEWDKTLIFPTPISATLISVKLKAGTDDLCHKLKGYCYSTELALRLIEVKVGKVWRSYLTSVLDPEILPFDRISLEMIYRGLYYFHGASSRGEAHDPVKYFAHPDIRKCLGIIKRQRKPKQKLIIAPFPDQQRGSDQFFFQSSPKIPLTTCL
jgi:hypothetical protein